MRNKITTLVLSLVFASTATAQAQPPTITPTEGGPTIPLANVRLIRAADVYDLFLLTGSELDLKEVCCDRSDVSPVIRLGCHPTPEPNTKYEVRVVLERTIFDNAEIRCYLVNLAGQQSIYSPNMAAVDFSPPLPN